MRLMFMHKVVLQCKDNNHHSAESQIRKIHDSRTISITNNYKLKKNDLSRKIFLHFKLHQLSLLIGIINF